MDIDEKTRKKIWEVELDLLGRFDDFCREYGFKYFMDFGSLLGTVRHKGFIPWDDDIDVMVFRPDFNRMVEVADSFFGHPYYLMHGYRDEGMAAWGMAKLINDDTTCIERRETPLGYHSGIFMDIFIYDDVIGGEGQDPFVSKLLYETWMAMRGDISISLDKEKYTPVLSEDMVTEIRSMSPIEKAGLMGSLQGRYFGQTEKIMWGARALNRDYSDRWRKRNYYENTVYMEFEGRKVPVPFGYDDILSLTYKDYMTPKKRPNHHDVVIWDTERSYREYGK